MNGQVEIREASSGKLVLRGYSSVSERWYPVGGVFEEKIKRGTWRRSLAEGPDVVLLQDHSGLGLARTKTPSGEPTLLLSETDRGLFCEAFLDATAPRVQDLRSTAENAGLQMSVAFRCSSDSWNEDRSRREIKEASVHRGDCTVCNFGANDAASATISERGEAGEKERRAYAESLKGATERRMCPVAGFTADDARGMFDMPPANRTRGRSQIAVPAPIIVRSYVEQARAKRAKLRGGRVKATRASSDLVLSPFGRDWEISTPGDVARAVLQAEIGHAAGPNEDAIKAWIFKRAEALDLTEMVPSGWKNAALADSAKVPRESPQESSSIAGQPQ
jgi:Phage head maturation protease